MLDRIDTATPMHNRLSARIDRLVQPYRRHVELLASVPGVSEHTAQVILAEIGSDIARFPSAGHLASWAGVCPGNNESAGKHSWERRVPVTPGSNPCSGRPRSPPPVARTPTWPHGTDD